MVGWQIFPTLRCFNKIEYLMDEKYVAFLLLESMYESGKINKTTYENVLKEKRNYIEEKYNLKDVTV